MSGLLWEHRDGGELMGRCLLVSLRLMISLGHRSRPRCPSYNWVPESPVGHTQYLQPLEALLGATYTPQSPGQTELPCATLADGNVGRIQNIKYQKTMKP